MRTLFISLVTIALIGLFSCSRSPVPNKVASAFKAKFPAAQQVKWSKESDQEFEAEFMQDGRAITATFDVNGNWIETETAVSRDELPAPVVAALDSQFADYTLKKAEKLEKEGAPVAFELKLLKDQTEYEVTIDQNGNVVSNKVETEANEQEEAEEPEEK